MCCDYVLTIFSEIPELQNLVGSSAASLLLQSNESNYPAALKDCFKQLMLCKEEIVVLETKNILERFSKQGNNLCNV